ncbi:Protein ecdysoneless-like protein [Golovinomyces cichoracearum]|uniref:Protein ecdysoneless-like protein n=1 Tax=Golovinomyces cichoracearum TaxID=62708 RepID=A0A420H7A4_9PEZI|nr:Protein ecdysoneless-like protein [Golovinomyces cichoracearum]
MGLSDEKIQGPSEDIIGLSRHLPEDSVEYSLFVVNPKLKSHDEIRNKLDIIRRESIEMTENLLKDYIWQRDCFNLEIQIYHGRLYLHGITNYSDSVEDEWLIVYILREITKKFQDLWIKVVDTFGELLLIEAANALPRWLNPEIADNRVWIHNNKLYIIPLCAALSQSNDGSTIPNSRPLELDESLEIISSKPEILINPPLIEKEAFFRLQSYPSQIAASLHHAFVRIPRKLAFILRELPSAISPAIEAFYLRDPIALKSLHVDRSKLVFSPDDLVKISIRFTRLLFAQIKSQEFSLPLSWEEIFAEAKNSGKEFLEQLKLGMKLTSGFEMLMKDSQHKKETIVEKIKILIERSVVDGNPSLPSDVEITCWNEKFKEDSESWMDVDYREFERELAGKFSSKNLDSNLQGDGSSGFGDAKTQADLRKIVERFESFLNDDQTGSDELDPDDMDIDNDEEYSSEEYSESEGEDKEISFDKDEYSRLMRELMGTSSEKNNEVHEFDDPQNLNGSPPKKDETNIIEEEDELNNEFEKNDTQHKDNCDLLRDCISSNISKGKGNLEEKARSEEDSDSENGSDAEIDIDFDLAKNLIESFRSQGGLAGPAGNLFGLMGIQMPPAKDNKNS